jgi:hypothetical protein
MKHISQYVLLLIVLVAGFTACQKADKLPSYGEGSAPQLTASASVVNPPPADSNKVVLTLVVHRDLHKKTEEQNNQKNLSLGTFDKS